MCWHVVLTTFLKDLPEREDLVRGGSCANEPRLVGAHEPSCIRCQQTKEDLREDFVGCVDKRDATLVAAIKLIALFVDRTNDTIHPFVR